MMNPRLKMSHEGVANECIGLSAFKTKINEFTEAAKVHSNDDGISRHRLAPFNAYYLT